MLRLGNIINRDEHVPETVHPITVKAEITVQVIKIAFKDKILLFF